MAGNRTPTNAKATRCKATEGAQQCLKAEHPKIHNHTWGARGETPQWRADGTPKPDRDHTDQLPRVPEGGYVDVPESPMDAAAMQTPATDPHGPSDALAAKHYPDPAPVGGYFNGDNIDPDEAAREEQRADHADQRRAAIAAAVTDQDRKDMERIGASHPHILRRANPVDAAEELVRAGLSTIAQPSQQGHALRHSLELARVTKLVEVAGGMFATLANGELVDPEDIRKVHALSRAMALTSEVDLSDPRGLVRGGGSA
jgi:hypothetical protein